MDNVKAKKIQGISNWVRFIIFLLFTLCVILGLRP